MSAPRHCAGGPSDWPCQSLKLWSCEAAPHGKNSTRAVFQKSLVFVELNTQTLLWNNGFKKAGNIWCVASCFLTFCKSIHTVSSWHVWAKSRADIQDTSGYHQIPTWFGKNARRSTQPVQPSTALYELYQRENLRYWPVVTAGLKTSENNRLSMSGILPKHFDRMRSACAALSALRKAGLAFGFLATSRQRSYLLSLSLFLSKPFQCKIPISTL